MCGTIAPLVPFASLAVAVRRAPPWTLLVAGAAAALFFALATLVILGATRELDLVVIWAFQSIASYRSTLP